MKNNKQNLNWINISLIAFTSMWSIQNIFNTYAQQGIHAIFSWIIIILLYFIPYVLIVSQLGTAFPNKSGGVSAWVEKTTNSTIAYLASWTYWIVNIPYLAQKPQSILISFAWITTGQSTTTNHLPSWILGLISLLILFFFMWLSSRGINTLKFIGSLAGGAMLFNFILLIGMAFVLPFKFNFHPATPHLSHLGSYVPQFDPAFFSTLSLFIFAVGGSEKISPYINHLKNGKHAFSKSMILLASLVGGSAILGTLALGILFNSDHLPQDLMVNGPYVAFQRLGHMFHLGNTLMILYAVSTLLSQAAALAISIDAPLRILLADNNRSFLPAKLMKKNSHGVMVNGYLLTGILTSLLMIIPALKIPNATLFYNWLINLNSIVIPFKFLFVFLAFIFLIKQSSKHKIPRLFLGMWNFGITLIFIIMGMMPKGVAFHSSQWWFQLTINILTPIVFGLLGIIFPLIKQRKDHLLQVEDFE